MAASSENLATSIDPFLLRHSLSDFSWLNPSENETLTKALQQPLYGNDHQDFNLLLQQTDNYQYDHQSFSPFSSSDLEQQQHHQQQPAHPTPSTLSDPKSPTTPKRRITTAVNAKSRITKRKSRATKKNQTTFITADPANFRQMVQQVTGIRFDSSSSPLLQPLSHLLLKPETRRPVVGRLYNACLPTLDTSSFLLDHHRQQQQHQNQNPMGDHQSYGAGGLNLSSVGVGESVEGGSSGGYGASDGFASFPTLESWKVM